MDIRIPKLLSHIFFHFEMFSLKDLDSTTFVKIHYNQDLSNAIIVSLSDQFTTLAFWEHSVHQKTETINQGLACNSLKSKRLDFYFSGQKPEIHKSRGWFLETTRGY